MDGERAERSFLLSPHGILHPARRRRRNARDTSASCHLPRCITGTEKVARRARIKAAECGIITRRRLGVTASGMSRRVFEEEEYAAVRGQNTENVIILLPGFHHKDRRSSEMKVKTHALLHVCTKEEHCGTEKRGPMCFRQTFDHDRYHRWESSELLAANKCLFHVRGTRG